MELKSESFLSFLTGYSGYRIFCVSVGTGCGAVDTFRAGCGTVVSVTAWHLLLSLVGILKKKKTTTETEFFVASLIMFMG